MRGHALRLLCGLLVLAPGVASAGQVLGSGSLWTCQASSASVPVTIWDLATDQVTARWLAGSGNGRGIAYDNRDDSVWVTWVDSAGGDGWIHKYPSRGGSEIATVPDPGGPASGIGALDWDPEEQVLWAAQYVCTGGQCQLFKIDPSTGAVLLTCSVAAADAFQHNDTLAVARPADLGGRKVVLTDAAEGSPLLVALDAGDCTAVKTYPLPISVTGIDIDDLSGSLVGSQYGSTGIFGVLNNLGPAPYSTVLGSFPTVELNEDVSLVPQQVVLGVRFASVEATREGGAARLRWQTLSEDGTLGFEVERAASLSGPFARLGARLEARGAGAGYELRDPDAGDGARWYRVVERTTAGARGDVSAPVALPDPGALPAAVGRSSRRPRSAPPPGAPDRQR